MDFPNLDEKLNRTRKTGAYEHMPMADIDEKKHGMFFEMWFDPAS